MLLKRMIPVLIFILPFLQATAQVKAVTDKGDEVILYDDGTWKYVSEPATTEHEVPMNPKEFKKPAASTFLVKSTKVNMGIWLDPKKWSFNRAESNEAAEFQFQLKDGDLYGMLITEKIQIPIETLRNVAVENARSAAPDVRVVSEEYRMVNGIKVLAMQMVGTIQGLKFRYYGYYYSNEGGTIQFLNYTSDDLFSGYLEDIEPFLNGLTEL